MPASRIQRRKSSADTLLASAPLPLPRAPRGIIDAALRARNVSCLSDGPLFPSRWFALAMPRPSSP